MHHQMSPVITLEEWSACYVEPRCPVQILVIDRPNGPGNVLVDTISRLMDQDVSVLSVEHQNDVLHALDCYYFDLVVVGLDENRPRQLGMMPAVHVQQPDVPILAIGRNLSRIQRQNARYYGAREVLDMPERAADLKALVSSMTESYLVGV